MYIHLIAGVITVHIYEEMAEKACAFSKWGLLKEIGLTEDQLLRFLVRGEAIDCLTSDTPTYGTVIELYYFAREFASSLCRKSNRILKCLMDELFPKFSISRADRLERRVKTICGHLDTMSKEELEEYLQEHWIPQPTGICSVYYMNSDSVRLLSSRLCFSVHTISACGTIMYSIALPVYV